MMMMNCAAVKEFCSVEAVSIQSVCDRPSSSNNTTPIYYSAFSTKFFGTTNEHFFSSCPALPAPNCIWCWRNLGIFCQEFAIFARTQIFPLLEQYLIPTVLRSCWRRNKEVRSSHDKIQVKIFSQYFVIIVHCEAKKTAPFYFCNDFVKSFCIGNNYWYTYTLINLERNDIKIVSLFRRVSLYKLAHCTSET